MKSKQDDWTVFRRVSEFPSAEALVEFLRSKGVPARVEAPNLLPGIEGYFLVEVSTELLHRARWFAPESSFDDAELDYLATGKLGKDEGK
jgi:hypothetical protein